MKKINYIIIAGFILLATIITSCKKWVNPDINDNPNQLADVELQYLLPSCEAAIAYQVGGDLSYAERMWMQQLAGGANQALAYDNYNFNSSEDDNTWASMYVSGMNNLNIIIKKASDQKSPYYGGIGKVLMAYTLGCVTDLFGDVPYSQAFQGNSNLAPGYDSQQQIYTAMNSLLTSAIADLSASTSLHSPGSDDLLYGGDVTKWTKAAYALQARYALHLAKRNGASEYTTALTALASAFTANTDDLEFHFGTSTNENGPIYQFLYNRYGDINVAEYMVDTLFHANDPRATLFVDTTLADGGPDGEAPGVGGSGYAQIGSYYANPDAPVPFISYVECLFIKAECEWQTNDKVNAVADYKAAVSASLDKYGVSNAAWVTANTNVTPANITLENIITQKYIALYLQLEAYTDWRRTTYPSHIANNVPIHNTNSNVTPRRYPYPTNEKEYNTNCPKTGAELKDNVWWN